MGKMRGREEILRLAAQLQSELQSRGLVAQAFGIVMNTGAPRAKRWPGCVL